MPLAPLPPLPAYTALWHIGWNLWFLKDDIHQKADSIANVWLLGVYLSTFMHIIGNIIETVANLFFDIDDVVREMLAWINGLIDGYTFQEILDALSWVYFEIRHNPWDFIVGRLTEFSWWFWSFMTDPTNTVLTFIEWWYPWIRDWYTNTIDFIIGKLTEHSWWFWSFLQDPTNAILTFISWWYGWILDFLNNPVIVIIDWIASYTGWFYDFIYDPVTWVYNKLVDLNIDLADFLANPDDTVYNIVKNVFGISEFELGNIPLWILNNILDNILSLRAWIQERLEKTVCEIILWFI